MKNILVVIPAYNEAENISKVIDELKKDLKNCDIVVINDFSSDNTKEIVETKKVKIISMPFNVGYAMAVQTGIKYAHNNNYNYVIQFDADGQHVAKEAKNLYNKILESNADIVIGSRFMVKTNYNHTIFRMIGTKVFSFVIKCFTKKQITDPTSGFQCLNKKVISRYSKMGNYPEFPDANLIIEMLYAGYQIEEIPCEMRIREAGVSMHSGIIKPVKYILKTFYSIIIIIIRNIFKKEVDY